MTGSTSSTPADDESGRTSPARWVLRGVGLVVALGLAVFVIQGANRPADPELLGDGDEAAAAGSSRRPLEGFEEVAFRITTEGGATADWCALLADTAETQSQGLMEQQDLRGYEAMVFRFDEPVQSQFFMRNTRIPLSIAFFDEDGEFVSADDMEPCPDDVENCPLHGAEAPYVHAIEVPQGELPDLGIGPGAQLSFPGGGCGG